MKNNDTITDETINNDIQDITIFSKYFCNIQTFYLNNKKPSYDQQYDKKIPEIIEMWNRFIPMSIKYFETILTYYSEKFTTLITTLRNIEVNKIDDNDKETINTVEELMKNYIYLIHLIEVELDYINTGTVYQKCEGNDQTIKTFNEITTQNKSLINRKVDFVITYGIDRNKTGKSKTVNYSRMKELLVGVDDNKTYSFLSLNGITYVYYQLQNLLLYLEADHKLLINPISQFESNITHLFTSLSERTSKELQQKNNCLCDFNKSFTIRLKNGNGRFALSKITKMVS